MYDFISCYMHNIHAHTYNSQEELKESDRTLMEIFKQLEGDVSDLSEYVGSWRLSATFKDGRPLSFTDLDGGVRPSSGHYDQASSLGTSQNSLESTLTSSKEEVSLKTSSGSDSLLVPEADTASSSNSPVLPAANNSSSPQTSNTGLTRRTSAVTPPSSSSGGHQSKRQTSASPQLKASASLNRIANTPAGVNRLQDDTSSNISRNSSIDSGIQFASENENGCANGVDSSHHFSSQHTTSAPQMITRPETKTAPTTTTTQKDPRSNKAESLSFADDIFSMLGMH